MTPLTRALLVDSVHGGFVYLLASGNQTQERTDFHSISCQVPLFSELVTTIFFDGRLRCVCRGCLCFGHVALVETWLPSSAAPCFCEEQSSFPSGIRIPPIDLRRISNASLISRDSKGRNRAGLPPLLWPEVFRPPVHIPRFSPSPPSLLHISNTETISVAKQS